MLVAQLVVLGDEQLSVLLFDDGVLQQEVGSIDAYAAAVPLAIDHPGDSLNLHLVEGWDGID